MVPTESEVCSTIKREHYDECVIVEEEGGGGGRTPTGSDIKSRSHPLRRSQQSWMLFHSDILVVWEF